MRVQFLQPKTNAMPHSVRNEQDQHLIQTDSSCLARAGLLQKKIWRVRTVKLNVLPSGLSRAHTLTGLLRQACRHLKRNYLIRAVL
jgi:hypothetical protein